MREFDWRAWVARLAQLWRSSLQVRTVAITVVLSSIAVFIIGGYMSFSVGTNLFDARRDQLISTSENATLAGQRIFDEAAEQLGAEDLELTMQAAADAIASTASTTEGTQFAILRSSNETGQGNPQDITSRDLEVDAVISDELRASVEDSAEKRTHWQSVGLVQDDGSVLPGLVVGSTLDIRGSQYGLYLIYNILDAQETLGFVQQTLVIGLLALIVLIGAVTYIVVRLVVGPVQLAAETSEKLAAGQLEVRIPVKGEDVIATLARSFNGMAASMQNQITRLAALSRVQQRFVSDVSHELRTPLTTIRLAGDVLYDQRGTFPPATARTAELLHTQVERFELLLADLLEMSRYDAGAVDMETEPTNLVRLVEDAIESVASLAESKGSDLRLVAPGGYFEAEVDSRAHPSDPAQPARQRYRPRRRQTHRGLGRQRHERRRDRRARLRRRDDALPRWSACSTGSGEPTRRASASREARDSGSRSRSRTPRCTAAGSRCGPPRERARASG